MRLQLIFISGLLFLACGLLAPAHAVTLVYSEAGQVGQPGSTFYYGWDAAKNENQLETYINYPYNQFASGFGSVIHSTLFSPQPPKDAVPDPKEYLVVMTTGQMPTSASFGQGGAEWWEHWYTFNGEPIQDGNDEYYPPGDGPFSSLANITGFKTSFFLTQDVFQIWEPGYVFWAYPTTANLWQTFSGGPDDLSGMKYSLQIFDVSAIPEPSSWAMLLLGFGGIGVAARKRRKCIHNAGLRALINW